MMEKKFNGLHDSIEFCLNIFFYVIFYLNLSVSNFYVTTLVTCLKYAYF